MSKKVVLVIVEGQTEELIFFDFLQERFRELEIRIDVQCGDVVSNWNRKHGNVESAIEHIIENYLNTYRLMPSDLLAVVQFTDTDGCFINDKFIRVDRIKATRTRYGKNGIYVTTKFKKLQMIDRNQVKAENMKLLAEDRHATCKRRKIPYRLYYFSINLDHVLWGEQNAKGNSKLEKAENFLDRLDMPLDQFLRQFTPVEEKSSWEENWKNSWEVIAKDLNSLQRSTNMPFVLYFIDSLMK